MGLHLRLLGVITVNTARIYEGGQVRIPAEILGILGLKLGDKIAFIQNNNGEIVLHDAAELAIQKAQKAFEGAAERLGVKNDDDVQKLVDDVRYEALSIFHELRKDARDVPEMSIEEIDAEIKAARAEKRMKLCPVTQ